MVGPGQHGIFSSLTFLTVGFYGGSIFLISTQLDLFGLFVIIGLDDVWFMEIVFSLQWLRTCGMLDFSTYRMAMYMKQ